MLIFEKKRLGIILLCSGLMLSGLAVDAFSRQGAELKDIRFATNENGLSVQIDLDGSILYHDAFRPESRKEKLVVDIFGAKVVRVTDAPVRRDVSDDAAE